VLTRCYAFKSKQRNKVTLAKPTLIVDWADLNLPFELEILGSNIITDMVTDAVRGMTSSQAAAKAQARAEELITKLGYKRW
jgi:hypothetical protein